ncbi:MAG: DEAD/DEAH box helicase family protein [Planctomycetota bacterium]|nr:MAG: DEAD/DEAH box helicase family protein [Planctomycetota bacterium]
MSGIQRFSSRCQPLDRAYLADRLANAKSYKRIAGYFRSSILELVGEEIAGIPDVRIVCNSDLDVADIAVSKAARAVALKAKFNERNAELEALLSRDRYRKLYDLLQSGKVQIRVLPKEKVFLHGKAGVIEGPSGKTCFLGSINETKSAFSTNYEILWEDPSPEGVAWVEEEFDALWADAFELPEAIVEEIGRIADRIEIRFEEAAEEDLPAATLAETPIYRNGEQLQPWQRSFVTTFLEHRDTYHAVRLLLADEVGLGKTLSLATAAMISALLGDGPVLILCPSTLTWQWQVELKDRLGIPSAVWHSSKKEWFDPDGHRIRTRGPEDIARCPYQIAIVSTGLIFHQTREREVLLSRKYGTLILDEAHKARRRGGLGNDGEKPNNLLDFMLKAAKKARHVLLGTATPIQTDVAELWDLLDILAVDTDFVLGRGVIRPWADPEKIRPVVTGEELPDDAAAAWDLCRNPLPPAAEHPLFASIRTSLDLADSVYWSTQGVSDLNPYAQVQLDQALEPGFFRQHNPVLRHTVLRRRKALEDEGLLKRIAVDIHPDPDRPDKYPGLVFTGLGLQTNHPFDRAYKGAEDFTTALQQRTKGAGFMRSMLLQRICSSFASGRSTAQKLLNKQELEDADEDAHSILEATSEMSPEETTSLRTIVDELSRPEARDPKLAAVQYFLDTHRTGGKNWLQLGCIIFSQYYDTAFWFAQQLSEWRPDEPVAVYAGVGRSVLFRQGQHVTIEREEIKAAVKDRTVRLLVATDAACEGLNLQTLGTLINVDLPWNPSRLEQRLGRIKRFGQARDSVDMLNLVYHETRDEDVYKALSRRLKDRYDIFGGLPDTIEDEWIQNIEKLEEQMDRYIHLRKQAIDAFDIRYQATIDPQANRWELCSRVLSRQDVRDRLSEPW